MKKILLAAVAASVLAGPAFAAASTGPTAVIPGNVQDRAVNIMNTPPWWFPTWGTWISGWNVKICKSLDFDVQNSLITITNTDGTGVQFYYSYSSTSETGIYAQLRLACDRSDDHDGGNWKHRWYKINIGQYSTNQSSGEYVTKLQGSWNAGNTYLYINEVFVPAGGQQP